MMGNEQCGRAKRQREVEPTESDVMFYARIIMERDPFKALAPRDEDQKLRALFGCPAKIVLIVGQNMLLMILCQNALAMDIFVLQNICKMENDENTDRNRSKSFM
jgi:hypothetical protein